jgi:hypothetical protein
MRRVGSSIWQVLPTRREGSHLVTRIDDARLPAGPYELRSRAVDLAGNEGSTQRRVDGSPMVLNLPIRFEAVMTGGVRRTYVLRKVVRRRGRRRVVKRRVVRFPQQARIALNRSVRIEGALTNPDGQPLAGAQLYVLSRSGGGAEALAGIVTTDARGGFSYLARATRNRVLRFTYLGTTLIRPAERQVGLLVPASSSLTASRRRVRNGGSVLFRGRVRSLPLPPTGKLLEIQAHFRGRWRTFSTVRANSRGRWRFRYRFGGTRGVVRYRFRVHLPKEGGYPFEAGVSRVVHVTVRGS